MAVVISNPVPRPPRKLLPTSFTSLSLSHPSLSANWLNQTKSSTWLTTIDDHEGEAAVAAEAVVDNSTTAREDTEVRILSLNAHELLFSSDQRTTMMTDGHNAAATKSHSLFHFVSRSCLLPKTFVNHAAFHRHVNANCLVADQTGRG
jgi:hypothetical protein